EYDAISRSWNWFGSYSPFLTVPPGKDYEAHLVEYLMGDRDGKKVLSEMKRKLMIPEVTTTQVLLEGDAPVVVKERKAPVRKPEAKQKSKPKAKVATPKADTTTGE